MTDQPELFRVQTVDLDAIEKAGARFHLDQAEMQSYRFEPYKPDGQRQMKAKGRWQRCVATGDYHRWENCERPTLTPLHLLTDEDLQKRDAELLERVASSGLVIAALSDAHDMDVSIEAYAAAIETAIRAMKGQTHER